jgi:hypothetical protein
MWSLAKFTYLDRITDGAAPIIRDYSRSFLAPEIAGSDLIDRQIASATFRQTILLVQRRKVNAVNVERCGLVQGRRAIIEVTDVIYLYV